MIGTVLNWLLDVDWRIVAVVATALALWRREDLAALLTRGKKKLTTEATEGTEKAIAKEPADDPIDALLVKVQKQRDALVAEVKALSNRENEALAQIKRIDALFQAPAPSPQPPTTSPVKTPGADADGSPTNVPEFVR